MRLTKKFAALLLLPAFLMASPAFAQQAHVVNPADMEKAVAEKANRDEASREVLLRVLQRTEVREMAERMGLSVEGAESAVAMLDGEELTQLAQQAAGAEASLAGGASYVVISVTTLLLLLILIVLIAR
jgi:Skp family chaperone for outer membrane proteins